MSSRPVPHTGWRSGMDMGRLPSCRRSWQKKIYQPRFPTAEMRLWGCQVSLRLSALFAAAKALYNLSKWFSKLRHKPGRPNRNNHNFLRSFTTSSARIWQRQFWQKVFACVPVGEYRSRFLPELSYHLALVPVTVTG